MPTPELPESLDVELATRPRFLEGSVRTPGGDLVQVRLTWQAWEEATGQPGPGLPPPDDEVAVRAAWLAATDDRFAGRTVDGFRLVEVGYIQEAMGLSVE